MDTYTRCKFVSQIWYSKLCIQEVQKSKHVVYWTPLNGLPHPAELAGCRLPARLSASLEKCEARCVTNNGRSAVANKNKNHNARQRS